MRTLLLILLLLTSFSTVSKDLLVLENGWVRAAPPAAKNLAGYGELQNKSTKSVSIASMSSPLFKKIGMHKTTFVDGMMKMHHMANIRLKPGEILMFSPGGMHFMLMRPNTSIPEGLKVPLHLTTKSGDKYIFELIVKK